MSTAVHTPAGFDRPAAMARAERAYGRFADLLATVGPDQWDLPTDELVAECRALVSPAAAGRRRTPSLARRLVRFPVDMGDLKETWTLGYLLDVVLTRDAWLHLIDLSRALGLEPVTDAGHDGPIVADVVRDWARRHGRAYDLYLDGPAGGHFAAGGPAEPLRIDAVEFCRVLSGRATGAGLLATAVPF